MKVYKQQPLLEVTDSVTGVLALRKFEINDTFTIEDVRYMIIKVKSSASGFAELETDKGNVVFNINTGGWLKVTVWEEL